MKKIFFSFLFFAFLLSIPAAFKWFTCGFKLAKMRLEMPFRSDWQTASSFPLEDLRSLLRQRFSYLDKGAQCYVFESGDGNYVIKFFRYDQPRYPLRKKKAFSQDKIEKLFSACLLAYGKALEETGLIYLHLNLTSDELPVLHARGPIGQSLSLPLDRYRFAIQKKARPFRQALLEAYHSSDPEALKKRIDSFLSLLQSRIEKGIGNSDPTLSRNFGFLDDRAVEIDFGNYYSDPASKRGELLRYTHRLRRWLKRSAPEWVSYLDEQVRGLDSSGLELQLEGEKGKKN